MKHFLFFLVAFGLILGLNAQNIPNGDFENWTGDIPDGWDTSNENVLGMAQFTNVTAETIGAPSGTTAAKVTSTTENIFGTDITLPGILTLGDFVLDVGNQTASINGGIPFPHRPTAIKGYYKALPVGDDVPMIAVGLSLWNETTNQRDTIGFAFGEYDQVVSEWTQFEIPIQWETSEIPDTMNIIIASVNLLTDTEFADGSTIWVDGLYFEYEAVEDHAITEVETFTGSSVAYGTPFADVELPSQALVTLDDASTTTLDIEWLQGSYPTDGDISDTYTLIGNLVLVSGVTNPSQLTAQIEVIIEDAITVVSVEELDDVTVDFGTPFANLVLPAQAIVTLSNTTTVSMDIVWYEGSYNGNLQGTYSLVGDLTLIDNILNPDQITAEIDVLVSEDVSIFGETTEELNVYPNPTSGLLNIKTSNIVSYSLVDITGRTILSESVSSDYLTIDLNEYSIGNYILIVNTLENSYSKLVVKN